MSQQLTVPTPRASVDLFTLEEHRILADWLGATPPVEAQPLEIEDALARLGVISDTHELYQRPQAAVAFIVLEVTAGQLPNCGIFSGGELTLTRDYRPKELAPHRKVALIPQHLFTVNWADCGPGISWPGAYYTTWVPLYERYVVTYSADTPAVFGYCDIALGHFGPDEALLEGIRRVITEDWRTQYDTYNQSRWAYLFGEGLVDEAEANTWADPVWPEEGEEW